MSNENELDIKNLKLEDVLVKPSDTYILKSGKTEKEVIMNYDLLMKYQEYATDEPVKWELGMMDRQAQMELISLATRISNPNTGLLEEMPNFKDFMNQIKITDLMDYISWVQDHVSDFFTIRLFNLEKRKSRPQTQKQQLLMTHLSQNFLKLTESVGAKNPNKTNL